MPAPSGRRDRSSRVVSRHLAPIAQPATRRRSVLQTALEHRGLRSAPQDASSVGEREERQQRTPLDELRHPWVELEAHRGPAGPVPRSVDRAVARRRA